MGKHIWNRKSTKGKKPEFGSSDELWRAACEYFEWATENPLIEEKPMSIAGGLVMAQVKKARVFTFSSLCIYLDIGHTTYKRWRSDETLAEACEKIDAVVYSQKFEGAAAGIFNAGIISRDLGLAEKTESTVKVTDDFDSLMSESLNDDE